MLFWDTSGINFIDSFRIFQKYERRDLAAAVKKYLGKDLEGAHGALADIESTLEVFTAQLEKHPDMPRDFAELNLLCNGDKKRVDLYGRFSFDADGDYIFTFGKHMNVKCKTQKDYLLWMLTSDFSIDTKAWCNTIISQIEKK